MIGQIGLLAVLAVALLGAVTDAKAPQKVVGGIPAYPGELPYQVSLRYNGRHRCGGVIISTRHILSAASCVKDLPDINKALVVTGSVRAYEGQTHKIKAAYYHPNWNVQTAGVPNDLAIIVLYNHITFTYYQNKINLPTAPTPSRVAATVSGWGAMPNDNGFIPDLSKLEVYTLSAAECQTVFQRAGTLYTSHICAYSTAGQGICVGDGGGPLTVNGEVVGIVSWGFLCGKGYPDVYTSVHPYIPWINDFLRST